MTAHRFFFALKPPPAPCARIGAVRDALGGFSNAVANDRLHLTLWVSRDHERPRDAVIAALLQVGAHVVAGPLWVTLERLSASRESVALRPRQVSKPLRALQNELRLPLSRRALTRPGWSFSPHVTLGYREGQPMQQPIEPITWEAREVVLVHSLVGETRHLELGRWPLEQRQLELGFAR